MARLARGEPSFVKLDSLHSMRSLEKSARSAQKVPRKKRIGLAAGAELLYGDDDLEELYGSDDDSEML